MGDLRRDDNREPPLQPKSEPDPEPGKYYYDDGTGYERYDPESDDEEENEANNQTSRSA